MRKLAAFTFLCSLAIIVGGRAYQLAYEPYLTESQVLCEYWAIWLSSLILVSISVALELTEQEQAEQNDESSSQSRS